MWDYGCLDCCCCCCLVSVFFSLIFFIFPLFVARVRSLHFCFPFFSFISHTMLSLSSTCPLALAHNTGTHECIFLFFFPWFAWWNEGEERKGGSGLAGEVVFIMVGRMVESWLENKCLVGNGKVGQVRSGQVRSGSRFFVGIE
jgi:hypothetical protein